METRAWLIIIILAFVALSIIVSFYIKFRQMHNVEITVSRRNAMNTVKPVLDEVTEEIDSAARKFPKWPNDPLHAIGVLNEEVGELNKECLQLCYEPEKSSIEAVRKEAVQAAAMAVRFLMSVDDYEFKSGEQHKQRAQ